MNHKNWDERARQKKREDGDAAIQQIFGGAAKAAGECAQSSEHAAAQARGVAATIAGLRGVCRAPGQGTSAKADHVFPEAGKLMRYVCAGMGHPGCGAQIVAWNSRNGVTPFMVTCSSCGETMMHTAWGLDHAAPEGYRPHHGQLVFRTMRESDIDTVVKLRKLRMEKMEEPELTPEREAAWREHLRNEVERGAPWVYFANVFGEES